MVRRCFKVGGCGKLWVRILFPPSFVFQVFFFRRADEAPECIWSNDLIHMVDVTPLVNIQLNLFSGSLCYVDLSLPNRCRWKIRADPQVVVGWRSLSSERMSVSANRKCQSGILPQRSATSRRMMDVLARLESLSCLMMILKSNDQFSPTRAPKYPILSAFRLNFLTFPNPGLVEFISTFIT